METNGVNVQIMWKEIAIIFIVLFSFRFLIDMYIVITYKQIQSKFYSNCFVGLAYKAKKLQKISDIFSNGPFNKKMRLIFNSICVTVASLAFLNNDDFGFLNQLGKVKKEDEFEFKSFILALYYRSKGDTKNVFEYYEKWLQSNHKNKDVEVVMGFLFSNDIQYETELVERAINGFQNPAIRKLFHKTGDGSVS